MSVFRVLVHGGAGVIPKDATPEVYVEALKAVVLKIGHHLRESGATLTAVDVVEYGVRLLEDEPLFNAGVGAVLTADGTHELEASIMDGATRQCGAASLLTRVKYPVSMARVMLAHPQHSYLVGEAAERLAAAHGLDMVENNHFTTEKRVAQLAKAKEHELVTLDHVEAPSRTGTVGCVCVLNGNVAAATSTGGMTNKLSGRVGDSPLAGCGNYADNGTCAISCTGVGEECMRAVAAYDVAARIAYGGSSLREALHGTLFERLPADSGGAIAVAADGAYAADFNCTGMYRGMVGSDGAASVGIWREEEHFRWL